MFNKYLFGFIEGFGEMLFPDFSRVIYSGSNWTATEDCFIVVSDYEQYAGGLHIDGEKIVNGVMGYTFFSGYVAKGSTIGGNKGAHFIAFALKRGWGS